MALKPGGRHAVAGVCVCVCVCVRARARALACVTLGRRQVDEFNPKSDEAV